MRTPLQPSRSTPSWRNASTTGRTRAAARAAAAGSRRATTSRSGTR
ncbi:MAG: hypothetical protein MZW92_71730 [Comamonadaceae bacterium]|nr:hypothetical protein [Comamonadaceae bacterium]